MAQLAQLTIAPLYAGLTALLLVVLSIRVTVNRAKHKVNIGDGGKVEMMRVIRTQANLAEYAPTLLILLTLLELGGEAHWVLHALGIVFIVGRLLHVTADLSQKPGMGRIVGGTLTWIVILVGGILALGLAAGMKIA
jgi:uncharacterized protein